MVAMGVRYGIRNASLSGVHEPVRPVEIVLHEQMIAPFLDYSHGLLLFKIKLVLVLCAGANHHVVAGIDDRRQHIRFCIIYYLSSGTPCMVAFCYLVVHAIKRAVCFLDVHDVPTASSVNDCQVMISFKGDGCKARDGVFKPVSTVIEYQTLPLMLHPRPFAGDSFTAFCIASLIPGQSPTAKFFLRSTRARRAIFLNKHKTVLSGIEQ